MFPHFISTNFHFLRVQMLFFFQLFLANEEQICIFTVMIDIKTMFIFPFRYEGEGEKNVGKNMLLVL